MSEINFLPNSYRQAQLRRRWRAREAAAGVLAVICLFAWWCVQQQTTERLSLQASTLRDAAAAAEDQQGELARLRNEYEVLQHQVQIRRELGITVYHSQILTKLAELLPEDVGLIQLKMITERPEPMTRDEYERLQSKPEMLKARQKHLQDNPGPDRILIEFEAIAPDDLTIATVVDRLSTSALFSEVKMPFSRQAERRGWIGRQFRVSAEVPLNRVYQVVAMGPGELEVADGSR